MSERLLSKRVILVTGTPCVGKTAVAHALTSKLGGLYVNLTELAVNEKLVLGEDTKRNTLVVNEKEMSSKIRGIIEESEYSNIIVDGHYAVNVVSEEFVSHVFVLRRNPVELRKLMEQRGYSGAKMWENLAAEILDVCLVDALNVCGREKVCEVDASSKSVEDVVSEILSFLEGKNKCGVGIVDWIGTLESQGMLDECLKI